MSSYRIIGSRLIDPNTGALVGFVDGNGNEVPLSAISGGTGTPVKLIGNYTLQNSDNGTIFYADAGTTWTVTVPTGLSPMPLVSFVSPATGSITLLPSGGAQIAGATSPVAVNAANAPSGAGLIPLVGQTDKYGLTSLLAGGYAGLTGAPTDNTAFNTWAAANSDAPMPTGIKTSAAHTFATADHKGNVFLVAQAADKTFTLPPGLPLNFECFVGYQNDTAAAGRLIIAPGAGVVVKYYTQNPDNATYVPAAYQNNTTRANIFMGKASVNGIAWCRLKMEGANVDTYTLSGQVGTFTTT